jgi:excinuclease UvrABC nuclease subunit
LGELFFRQAPENPGVYLLHGAKDEVLYVGKAKNLCKRPGNYRTANPDKMPRRHLFF